MTRRLLPAVLFCAAAFAQDEDFRIYKDPPRIFLNAQRLRRLQRETQRETLRWRYFKQLIEGKAQFPEPGFAWALHYAVTNEAASLQQAADWAAKGSDIRQLAFLYDWCGRALSPEQKSAVAAKLLKAISAPASGVGALRNQTLAAIALGPDAPEASEKILRYVVKQWWRQTIVPALQQGKTPIVRDDLPALYEIMHALRDSLNIDLREDAHVFFKPLPVWHLLSHYPAPLPAAENEYRIPAFTGGGEPDLARAALSRSVELMMVAYDNNASDSQFLQGWLIQDRFLMRGAFGLPYEFLWANPYQPGLPFEKMDPFLHDTATGRFFVRSDWEENATWFGYFDGQMQLFEDGQVHVIRLSDSSKPIEVGIAKILVGKPEMQFEVTAEEGARYFILGLTPGAVFDVEVDDQEMYDATTDRGGILALSFAKGTKAWVLVHPPRMTAR